MAAEDRAATYGVNVAEAESCALLKSWLTNNWQEITNKAAGAREKKDREYKKPANLGGYSLFR